MNRLFIGNFDFEHALSAKAERDRTRSGAVQRLQHELAAIWPAVADDGDFIWLPAPVEAGFFEESTTAGLPQIFPVVNAADVDVPVEACPWGWTDDIRKQCEGNGWKFAAPPQEVIGEVNSRRFSLELERSWGIGLEGAAVIRNVDELRAAIERMPAHVDRWVVKAEFGMSARERILGRGRELDEQTVNWLRNRTGADEVAVIEPWVERLEEAGLQFTVPWSGVPVFEGIAVLLCDSAGQYRGSRFAQDVETELRWMPAIETGMRVARFLKQLGYFGPLGIDAMRFRDADGKERMRSVQDINARHSMGRLALGLRRVLKQGEHGSWLHVRWPTESVDAPRRWFDKLAANLPAGVRVIRTSPFTANKQPVGHGTLVIASKNAPALYAVETQAMGQDSNLR
ncbi:MAG: hypothetical protein HON53_05715 [Planctomycetaceae bacterium]|jgi:hypothetical protein|nr:hypothetical protein [Planctomycetaceae bacterium]MBT6153567.1 hypothetical protein [Planctomycetaceae bacterium]MBT6483052.1 hypothetical protein [Planctomycetaceae bacterium]MBT6497605.1 hypothetical protein [Planctomycetaceae bacterium]